MPRPIEALIHTSALAHNLTRARAAAPDAKVWAVVKANAYGHGIERAYDGLRGADGFALLDLSEAERIRALGWRGPVLLLEGAFEQRDLELCSRLDLWHVVHCSRTDRLAGRAQDARAAARFPEDEQRHEPAGLFAGGVAQRMDTLERAAASRRDHADDALLGRRRAARHRAAGGSVRDRHARPARRTLAGQQRRGAAPSGAWPRTGCARAS